MEPGEVRRGSRDFAVHGSSCALVPSSLRAPVGLTAVAFASRTPPVCVLDFDGDLFDHLIAAGISSPSSSRACFHTSMQVIILDGVTCGVVSHTIGGPYAVLVAAQLRAAGAKMIVGKTSAGRVSPDLPLPSIVIPDEAIRDEGTSLHYLAASPTVSATATVLLDRLVQEMSTVSLHVHRGCVWTTDAPYPRRPNSCNIGRTEMSSRWKCRRLRYSPSGAREGPK
jgi:hypothetical protein